MSLPNSYRGSNSAPLEMTDTLYAALARIASNDYRRHRNEWRTPSGPSIKPDTVARLKARNMVEIHHGAGRDSLTITEIGKAIAAAVAEARRRRRTTA